jgi:hypothetical protein
VAHSHPFNYRKPGPIGSSGADEDGDRNVAHRQRNSKADRRITTGNNLNLHGQPDQLHAITGKDTGTDRMMLEPSQSDFGRRLHCTCS